MVFRFLWDFRGLHSCDGQHTMLDDATPRAPLRLVISFSELAVEALCVVTKSASWNRLDPLVLALVG